MKLIIITPEHTSNEEASIVNRMFDIGLQRLHLRKSLFKINDYKSYIETIQPKYHARIVVHGGFDLVQEFGLAGIHLNSAARGDKMIWELAGDFSPSAISTSFHAWKEIEENEFPYGYVFISPVFDSISKTGYKASIDLTAARHLKSKFLEIKKYCPAIIGLGGVGERQVSILQQHGFDGAAMLGAIWMSEDPVARYAAIAGSIVSG